MLVYQSFLCPSPYVHHRPTLQAVAPGTELTTQNRSDEVDVCIELEITKTDKVRMQVADVSSESY